MVAERDALLVEIEDIKARSIVFIEDIRAKMVQMRMTCDACREQRTAAEDLN